MRWIASTIASNTNNKEEDVYNLFKTTAEDLSKEARFHTDIVMYKYNVAIASCDGENDDTYRIIASKAADKMLTLKGVDAAFAIVRIGEFIHISGRSNGKINVQLILEKLKGGGHFDLEMRKWDVAVKNMFYCGTDLMPYYNSHDEGGFKYGSELYLGDPFFRVYDDNTSGLGQYDRLEVCYEPSVGKYLKVRIAAVFHFNNFHYSGCQQVVGLKASF